MHVTSGISINNDGLILKIKAKTVEINGMNLNEIQRDGLSTMSLQRLIQLAKITATLLD